jgi:xanthine dehydrogenase accessory factor
VLVYGGGHVGAALVAALAPLPFEVRWIDARARGFLVPPPAGVATRLTPLPEEEALAAPADAFHVVLTHSHALDLEIVAAVLERDAFGFLGLIGSATKRALFARRLRERGIPAERLDRLTCPIGLPGLRDKRPAVIAASTAAQLLQIDAAGKAAQHDDRTGADRPLLREPEAVSRTPSPAGYPP